MSDKFKIENRRYLGSKARLIEFIKKIVSENCGEIHSFADIFGGTGNVGWAFNSKKTKVIINDILKSNYYAYLSFFGCQKIDLNKLKCLIDDLNNIDSKEDNYFSINFSGTYFSKTNCKKIGFIREKIETLFLNEEINEREHAFLITSLIYAMDHIANTVGHYDAFRINGDLNKVLELKLLDVPSDGTNKNNEIYNQDANALVKNIKADVVYIDPPYNSRQYCDAYHLLENVASWEKPIVYGIAKKMKRDKNIKSDYCTQKAPEAFDNLVQSINAKYILVSFNNMGTKGAGRSQSKISDEDIIGSLSKRGNVQVFSMPFNQFTTGKTKIENHEERLFLCKVKEKDDFVKSPLNYTGGKFKLLPQLMNLFLERKTFIDIFAGGFNVGVNSTSDNVVYNDKCNEVRRLLELMYKNEPNLIVENVDKIIKDFSLSNTSLYGYEFYGCNSSEGLGKYNKHNFEKLKRHYNELPTSIGKDYCLLTLVFYSFNNQIRFNSKGEFNLPVGKRDFNKSLRKHLIDFCKKMSKKAIEFSSIDFSDMQNIDENCFVYCDPPYFLGLASYNENAGWNIEDEKRLLNFLISLNEKNVKFALSNLIQHHGIRHPLLDEWCIKNKFKMHYIKADYSNSNYHIKDKKAESVEVLITNY